MKKVCNNSKLVDADLVTFRNTFGCENKFFPNDIVSCFGYGPFKVKHILGLGFGRSRQMNYLLVYVGDVSKLEIATWQASIEERKYYNVGDKDFLKIALEEWIKSWIKKEEEN